MKLRHRPAGANKLVEAVAVDVVAAVAFLCVVMALLAIHMVGMAAEAPQPARSRVGFVAGLTCARTAHTSSKRRMGRLCNESLCVWAADGGDTSWPSAPIRVEQPQLAPPRPSSVTTVAPRSTVCTCVASRALVQACRSRPVLSATSRDT